MHFVNCNSSQERSLLQERSLSQERLSSQKRSLSQERLLSQEHSSQEHSSQEHLSQEHSSQKHSLQEISQKHRKLNRFKRVKDFACSFFKLIIWALADQIADSCSNFSDDYNAIFISNFKIDNY